MAEKISNNYVSLFEIRLMYHARTGAENFDTLAEKEQEEYLSAYDSRSFFHIAPTEGTKEKFKNSGWICKDTSFGCIVAAPDSRVDFLVETTLEFQVKVLDQKLRSAYAGRIFNHVSEEKSYRCKEVLMFSNGTGDGAGAEQNGHIFFFSRQETAQGQEKTSEEGQGNKYIAAICKNDAPQFRLPLNGDISKDIFAFVRLEAVKQDEQGRLLFEINFEQCERTHEETATGQDEDKTARGNLLQKIKNSLSGR